MLEWLRQLKQFFFVGDDEVLLDNLHIDKPALVEVFTKKEIYRTNWDLLISGLRINLKGGRRLRDCEEIGQRHSFNAIYYFDFSNKAIIFSICLPFNLIGYRYATFVDAQPTEKSTPVQYKQIQSYFILDSDMKTELEYLERIISSHFQNFIVFNNDHAAVNVPRIIVDSGIYKNIELWKALFCTTDHGII